MLEHVCNFFVEKPEACDPEGTSTPASKKGRNYFAIIFLIFLVAGGLAGVVYFQRRSYQHKTSKEVTIQMDMMVSQYFAIGEDKTERKNDYAL